MTWPALPLLLLAPMAWAAAGGSPPSPEPSGNVVARGAQPAGLPLLPAPTAPVTVPMAVDRIEAFDRQMASLSADFRQQVRWENADSTQELDGHVDYRKPQLLRVEQKSPEPQLVVGDGQWLWVYRQSTDQVIQTRMADWKKAEPLAEGLLDFGAYARLLKRYEVEVTSVAALSDGHSRFELTLRPRPGRSPSPPQAGEGAADFTLKLRMTTRDFFPTDTELRSGSVVVRSLFSNIRYNPTIPESRFQFKPPPGVEVFKNFKPPQPE